MTTIDNIVEMKREPGVIVVGGKNVDAKEVFDDVNRFLSEFYLDNGFVFVSKTFIQTKYFCPVYLTEILEKGKKAQEHATIKIERFREESGIDFIDELDDSVQTALRWKQIVFGVYFNLVKSDKAMEERNNFLKYAEQQLN